jgi:hypothetical protein
LAQKIQKPFRIAKYGKFYKVLWENIQNVLWENFVSGISMFACFGPKTFEKE